jgi:hypothetical protein
MRKVMQLYGEDAIYSRVYSSREVEENGNPPRPSME